METRPYIICHMMASLDGSGNTGERSALDGFHHNTPVRDKITPK